MLPPKALHALVDIKKSLLSKEMPPSDVVFEPEKRPPTFKQRRVKMGVGQSAKFWSQFR